MTENSMFFSDGSWYTQNMFARFISDIFGEGVVDGIDNELEVSANTPANMAVQVKTGRSYVKGYIHEILTDAVQLTISDADTTNPRIDRIVLRLDVNTNRRIRVAVLKGTAAASPVAPTLTQTSSIWEISLAQVYVSANATVINSGNITDERTFMTMQRANIPLASKTAVGSVKVGDGIDVSDGVVSITSQLYTYTIAPKTTYRTIGTGASSTTYVVSLPLLILPPGNTFSGTFKVDLNSAAYVGTPTVDIHTTDVNGTTTVSTASNGVNTIPANTNSVVLMITTQGEQSGYHTSVNVYDISTTRVT